MLTWIKIKCITVGLLWTLATVAGTTGFSRENCTGKEQLTQKYVIVLHLQNVTVEKALDVLSEQTKVKLAYNNEVIDRDRRITVHVETKDIEKALTAILGNEYAFKQIDGYIAIYRRPLPMAEQKPHRLNLPVQVKDTLTVEGLITDGEGNPLVGVNILVKGKGTGVESDLYGRYRLTTSIGDHLEFRYIGFLPEERAVRSSKVLNVRMTELPVGLGDVVVIGYGQQKKSSVVSSIQTITSKDMNVKHRNPVTQLAGRIAGVFAVQRSGEPGNDEAEFYIRGQSSFAGGTHPLVLVDGIPRNIEDIDVDEIESFTVLKDAAATAVYGAEGANGVVLITSKRGQPQKTMVYLSAQYAVASPMRMPRSLNACDYLTAYNEAVWNDQGNPDPSHFQPEVSEEVMRKYRTGEDPDLYPSVDWTDLLSRHTQSKRYTIHFRGGSEKARFFVSGTYFDEEGIYRSNPIEQYDANIHLKRYNVRSNIDLNVTPSTQLSVDLSGQYRMKNSPGFSSDEIFSYIIHCPTHVIPMVYSDGSASIFSNLGFGHDQQPYSMLNHSGYTKAWDAFLKSKVAVNQKLDFLLKGLSAKAMIGFDADFGAATVREKSPKRFFAMGRDPKGGLIKKTMSEGVALSDPKRGETTGAKRIYLEASLNYQRTLQEKHELAGLLLYMQKETQYQQEEGLFRLPYRKQSVVARLSYGYDQRYLIEASMGATGSENFAKHHRWGIFPAVGLAWYISHERFMKPILPILNKLKVRMSWGLAGNDDVFTGGNGQVRFPYRGQVSTHAPGYDFGLTPGAGGGMTNWIGGLYEQNFASPNLSWETEQKWNIGLDMGLWDGRADFSLDFFSNRRKDILIQRKSISAVTGFRAGMYQNYGITTNKGVDAYLTFRHQLGPVRLSARGNFTFAKNKIVECDEITPKYSWMQEVGTSIGQQRLYIAEGLYTPDDFITTQRADGSFVYQLKDGMPRPAALVAPGDIKYKDLNGDGRIDSYDQSFDNGFYSTGIPEMVYGFGMNLAWKGWFVGVFFQGVARAAASLIAAPRNMIPFAYGKDNGSAREIIQNRWRTDRPYYQEVCFPRLHSGNFEHNQLPSTWWMRNAGFLRLKNVELGYELPSMVLQKIRMENARIFIQGNNLAVWDHIRYWDPELGNANSGAKYPLCRDITVGLEITY